ncbi:hypothetical protein MTR67_023318 [Solanum verrucosum]|uniref:Putative plant transposon protein domain-containing protein n=1 Tax=Solanum verrucosum TaxID=315347 RepID=A0AAF0TYK0_SOLVR|nr:hypothetical protein MTR67_023318 [Solanum verrucosum]
MARSKVPGKNQPPQKKAKGVVIAMGIDSTPFTISESDHEENSGSISPVYEYDHADDQLLKKRRAGLHSKALHDPSRLPVLPTPPPPPAQVVEKAPKVPPVQAPPPRSINRLKAAGLRTILEEKRLSTNGVEDMYPDVKLIPKGKKKANSFAPTDYVEVQGKTVNCSNTKINKVLGCTIQVVYFLVDKIQKNTLDYLKVLFSPLISDITSLWIETVVHIEKKDLNIAARYWFGFISNTLMPSHIVGTYY